MRNFIFPLFGVLLFCISTNVLTEENEEYVVKKGDNLWSISRKYDISQNELMELNNLQNNKIKPGQILQIPKAKKFYFSIPSHKIKEKVDDGIIHTVRQNETLWDIARKYKVKVDQIKQKNNLTSNIIKPGQRILVPDEKNAFTKNNTIKTEDIVGIVNIENIKPLPDINKIEKKEKNILQDRNFVVHNVVKNETLWDIARKYKVKVDEIKLANNLLSNTIKPKQSLIIPVSDNMSVASLKSQSIAQERKRSINYTRRKNIPSIPSTYQEENTKTEEVEDEISGSELENIKDERAKVVALARRYLGVRYRWGGTTSRGFDCSGFVKYVYNQVGENLPRSSREQFNVGIPVRKDELKPGDRVFFSTYRRGPSHVGIYIGDGKFIHASSKRGERYVKISSLYEPYYSARYIGARR